MVFEMILYYFNPKNYDLFVKLLKPTQTKLINMFNVKKKKTTKILSLFQLCFVGRKISLYAKTKADNEASISENFI